MKQYDDPLAVFTQWYKEAQKCSKIGDASAVNLATSTKDGKPSNRMVLLKSYDEQGFVFYTNLNSRKGCEIQNNPRVSMCFYWEGLDRQVRIEGEAVKVSDQEADDYFNSRPIKSRIGAWASKQSQTLLSSTELMKRVAKYTLKISKDSDLKRPEFWSGYRVVPNSIEFWKHGEYRLHNRVIYKRKNDEWEVGLLYP
ncbi:pyridoxamine 5'-phosphate oxidase [Rickettsiales bacterium]|nr:pyridoxamine 5'-phosphate oxidase [Rickettsiales bacterium]